MYVLNKTKYYNNIKNENILSFCFAGLPSSNLLRRRSYQATPAHHLHPQPKLAAVNYLLAAPLQWVCGVRYISSIPLCHHPVSTSSPSFSASSSSSSLRRQPKEEEATTTTSTTWFFPPLNPPRLALINVTGVVCSSFSSPSLPGDPSESQLPRLTIWRRSSPWVEALSLPPQPPLLLLHMEATVAPETTAADGRGCCTVATNFKKFFFYELLMMNVVLVAVK